MHNVCWMLMFSSFFSNAAWLTARVLFLVYWHTGDHEMAKLFAYLASEGTKGWKLPEKACSHTDGNFYGWQWRCHDKQDWVYNYIILYPTYDVGQRYHQGNISVA